MILNDVEICNFQSLRVPGAFTFPAFWEQKDEFFEVAWDAENKEVNDLFFGASERELGTALCKCLTMTTPEIKYFIKEGKLFRKGESLPKNPAKEIIALEEPLCSKYEELQKRCSVRSKKTIVGLIVLYKLLEMQGMDCDLDVDECLRILESNSNDLSKFYVRCNKDLLLTEVKGSAYPLEAKVLVNISDKPIRITKGEETVCLEALECVVGIFHEQQCYKLLPRKGENERVELSILYSQEDFRIYLQVLDKKTGKTSRKEDVVSFYIDERGYVYVTRDGKVVIPESERANTFSIKRRLVNLGDQHIVAIVHDERDILGFNFIYSTN